jgi:hypothetical protein
MPLIRINLDTDCFNRLAESAIEELRPIPWQAEVLLRRALGLPFPCRPEGARQCPLAQQPQEVPRAAE